MQETVVATESISFTRWIEYAATGIELLAVLIIPVVILVATVLYLLRILSARADENTYKNYRHGVARAFARARDTRRRRCYTHRRSGALVAKRACARPLGDHPHFSWLVACR